MERVDDAVDVEHEVHVVGSTSGAQGHACASAGAAPRHRIAYFGGLSHSEIARKLDVPIGTVKGRLRIGLQKMRAFLGKMLASRVPSMTHDELRDLLGAYALHALSPDERDATDAHLRTCAQCRTEVAELRRVQDQLGLLAIERDPPPSLRVHLMAIVEQDRREWEQARVAGAWAAPTARKATNTTAPRSVGGSKPGAPAHQPAGSWWQRLIDRTHRTPAFVYGMGGMVALALIVVGVWLFNRNNVNTLHTYACSAPQASVGGADFRTTNCTLVVRSNHTIEVAFNDLPSLRPTQAYELWVLPTKGNPVPVTGFEPGGTQNFDGTYKINASRFAKAAVTIEQAPGNSPVPHGPIALVIPFDSPVKKLKLDSTP